MDLHIHSTFSDGALTPIEIIDIAFKNNVSIISIADHDNIEAYNEELFSYAKKNNITLIPAVEISTKTTKNGIHVLGYNFDLNNELLRNKLCILRNSRHDYLKKVAFKLNQLGYILNIEELDKIDAVTKAHIALDVINNKNNNDLLITSFNHIPKKGEFIETIMNESCPAYVEKETISPKEAAELIRNAGGKVILAHPVAYIYEDNLEKEDILNIIREMKPDGIEANYIYIDRFGNKKNDIKEWNSFAKYHHLITTLGSDFHNIDGIHPEIGLINETIDLSDSSINKIINDLLK